MAANVEAHRFYGIRFHIRHGQRKYIFGKDLKTVKPEKQALGIFLSLEGQARAAVDEMNLEKLN